MMVKINQQIHFTKILKYEFLNIIRNRWLFIYTILVFAMSFGFTKISGDSHKALVTLSFAAVVFVPLMVSLFTSLYWYYNDRFTELMLTQPIPRSELFIARFFALAGSLSFCFLFGHLLSVIFIGEFELQILLLDVVIILLSVIFCSLTTWLVLLVQDRLKGMGVVFSVWLYFVLVHDGIILLMLLALKDYPLDIPGGVLGSLSPIGLARVALLMSQESSMLLGHTGALIREILTSWVGYMFAFVMSLLWMTIPTIFAYRSFKKKDF